MIRTEDDTSIPLRPPNREKLLSQILANIDICADCSSRMALHWVVMNRGVIVCNECAGIHRTMGTHVSVVKCLRYPPSRVPRFVTADTGRDAYWDEDELEMVLYFAQAADKINGFWGGGMDSNRDFVLSEHWGSADPMMTDPLVVRRKSGKCGGKKGLSGVGGPRRLGKGASLSRSRNLLLPRSKKLSGTKALRSMRKIAGSTLMKDLFPKSLDDTITVRYKEQNFTENGFHVPTGRFSKHFQDNPLFVAHPIIPSVPHTALLESDDDVTLGSLARDTRFPSAKADFIRSKYQLLTYVAQRDRPDVRNPRGAYDTLNIRLLAAVQGSSLESSLDALALGADPNVRDRTGRTVSVVALNAGQRLQYRLLWLWGSHEPYDIGERDIDTSYPKSLSTLRESCGFQVVDCLNRFARTFLHYREIVMASASTQVPSFIGSRAATQMAPEDMTSAAYSVPLPKYPSLRELERGTLDNLTQDLYDEVLRRENELALISFSVEVDVSSIPNVSSLPINPDLTALRNGARQKMARISDTALVNLVKGVLGECMKRNPHYARRLIGTLLYPEKMRSEIGVGGPKAVTNALSHHADDHVYARLTGEDGCEEEPMGQAYEDGGKGDTSTQTLYHHHPTADNKIQSQLSSYERALEYCESRVNELIKNNMFAQNEVRSVRIMIEEMRCDNYKTNRAFLKILASIGLKPFPTSFHDANGTSQLLPDRSSVNSQSSLHDGALLSLERSQNFVPSTLINCPRVRNDSPQLTRRPASLRADLIAVHRPPSTTVSVESGLCDRGTPLYATIKKSAGANDNDGTIFLGSSELHDIPPDQVAEVIATENNVSDYEIPTSSTKNGVESVGVSLVVDCADTDGIFRAFETFLFSVFQDLRFALNLVSNEMDQLLDSIVPYYYSGNIDPPSEHSPEEGKPPVILQNIFSFLRLLKECHRVMTGVSFAVQEASRDLLPILESRSNLCEGESFGLDRENGIIELWKEMIKSTTTLQKLLNSIVIFPHSLCDCMEGDEGVCVVDANADDIKEFFTSFKTTFDSNSFICESLSLARTLKSIHDYVEHL